jgi:magnesium transporter
MPTATSHEALQDILRQLLELMDRNQVLDTLARQQQGPKQELLEQLTHRQNLAALHNRLRGLHPADLAYVLEALPLRDRLEAWAAVPPPQAAQALVEVSPSVRESLLERTPRDRLRDVLLRLDADDLAYLADAIEPELLDEVTRALSAPQQSWVRTTYPPGSVGQLMSPEVVTIQENLTCEEVLGDLRAAGELPPQTDGLFALDVRHVFRGVLPLRVLLTSAPGARVADVMSSDAPVFVPDQPAYQAASAFERYDLVSAPVVDERGKLAGRVTVEAVMDFLRRQAEMQALHRAGLSGDEDLFAPAWTSARNRGLWLGLNLVTAFLASRVIGLFESAIVQIVALATLMPVVASVGGNTGNQTMTLLIRALALGQLGPGNVGHLLRKELGVALMNGLMWGSVMGLVALLLYRSGALALVMAGAVALNLLVAAGVALAVPLLLARAGRDPAQGASVLLTFSTDAMGFFIFLGLARLFLL